MFVSKDGYSKSGLIHTVQGCSHPKFEWSGWITDLSLWCSYCVKHNQHANTRGIWGHAPRKILTLRLHFRTLLVQLWQVQLLKYFTINNTVHYGNTKLLVAWCDLSGKLCSNFFLLFFSVLNAIAIQDFQLSPPRKHETDKFMCLPLIMIYKKL